MTDSIANHFADLLKGEGVELNSTQIDQFAIYYRELVEWNNKMNLTGITEREQVYLKHFYDSVSLSFFIDLTKVRTLADIGSGAGFPGVPLLIAFPHLKLTIIDSLNKRIGFLKHLADKLSLEVECIHGRAEELGKKPQFRDQFDLVTARAVARLSVLNEFCLPFVKASGMFVAMKGSDPQDEIHEASYSMKELKAKLLQVHRFELSGEQAERHLIILQKTARTPEKYPRSPGIPLKKPLIGKGLGAK